MHPPPAPLSPRAQRLLVERRLWIGAYVFALFAPLLLMVFAPRSIDPTLRFAIALGFVAFVGMGLQVLLACRAPAFTVPMGMDLLVRMHRYMGSVVVVLVVIHVAVIYVTQPWARSWLYPPPLHGPSVAVTGFAALSALILIGATSIWRPRWLSYEAWRLSHLALTVIAIGGAYAHVLQASEYSSLPLVRGVALGVVVVAASALVYLRIGRVFTGLGRQYRVLEVVPERGDVTTLRLEAVGHAGIPLAPGQFAWLRFGDQPWSLTEHPFSLSSSAVDPSRPSFSVKASGDFTAQVRHLAVGTPVLVDGPHGAWEPPLLEAGYLLIVAGIGVTPAMSVLRTMADLDDRRPVQLVYGARTWGDVTFREELQGLASVLDLELVWVVSRPDPDWSGLAGRIDRSLLERVIPADAAARNVLVCGPRPMLDSALDALHGLGIPDAHVRAERFEGA